MNLNEAGKEALREARRRLYSELHSDSWIALKAIHHIRDESMELLYAYEDGATGYREHNGKPYGTATELADIVIICLGLASLLEIDLEDAIRRKMAYNATRPPVVAK